MNLIQRTSVDSFTPRVQFQDQKLRSSAFSDSEGPGRTKTNLEYSINSSFQLALTRAINLRGTGTRKLTCSGFWRMKEMTIENVFLHPDQHQLLDEALILRRNDPFIIPSRMDLPVLAGLLCMNKVEEVDLVCSLVKKRFITPLR